MATDFGGKGSRRTFAARLLREVQAQSVVSGTLVPQIAALPVGTLVSTDRLPAVSVGGAGKTLTPLQFRNYVLGITGGISSIPEPVGLLSTLSVNLAGEQSASVDLDIASRFGVRPSSSVTYPTVLTGGFGGRFYAVHTFGDWGFVVARAANDTFGANLTLYHTRSATGARTILQNGDWLGRISFQGVSQTSGTVVEGAAVVAAANGAVSAGVLPTELRFHTIASGAEASATTARWIMQSAGHLVAGTDNAFDIGASASLRPRTGHFGTSVATPLITNAGTLNVRTTGNNALTLGTNSTTRLTIAGTGAATFTDTVSASNLSGTNTGDQTITLTSDVTGSGTGSFAATIANDAVTYAKMQNVSAASRLLGRGSAGGAGDVEEITIGSGLSMSGTTLNATGGVSDGDKGDITVSASGATWTIDNGAVSYAKIQNVAANTFLANATGSPATVQEIATDRIPLFGSGITGTPSASTYLRGDGAWVTVSGSGDVVGPASATDNAVARFDLTTGKLIQNSAVTIADTGAMTIEAGAAGDALMLTATGSSQLKLRYDVSNHLGLTIGSTGLATMAFTGTTPKLLVNARTDVTATVPDGTDLRAGSFSAEASTAGLSVFAHTVAGSNSGAVNSTSVNGLVASAAHNSSGTTPLVRAMWARPSRSAGAVTDIIGLDVDAISSTATNAYGIRVSNITGGSSLNYAIYTNSGEVRFGDVLRQSATISGAVADADGAYIGMVSTVASPNTQTRATGLRVSASLQNTGTVGTLTALTVQATRSAGTATNVVGLQVGSHGIASATTQYGIKVENVTSAATNYAVYTGTGQVRFGDYTQIDAGNVGIGLRTETFRSTVGGSTVAIEGRAAGIASSGTHTTVTGVYGQATHSDSATVNALRSGWFFVSHSAGSVLAGVGVDISVTNTSAMNEAFGLRIGNVSTASINNYAIYTGTGLVRFGDVVNTTESYQVDGVKVVGNQGATISDPTGGTVQDSEARTAINTIIDRLQAHGLIA